MLLYYITDRHQFPGDECRQREQLLARIAAATRAGVDFIQLRERDLGTRELEELAGEAARMVRDINRDRAAHGRRPTLLFVNSRTDVALAAEADGVHLRADDISASEARVIWHKARKNQAESAIIAVSCHTTAEVRRAEADGADFAVFAPVFEKVSAPQRPGMGLAALRQACAAAVFPANVEGVGAGRMPVLALGGVTLENARDCIAAGAAGIAGIRLFQEHDVEEVVEALRG